MHLVYLNSDRGIPLRGTKGASAHVFAMVKAFCAQTARVTVISSVAPKRGEAVSAPLACEVIDLSPASSNGLEDRELESLERNEVAADVLEGLNRRHPIGAIYERSSLWSVAGAEVAARLGIPWILEVNAPLPREAARHRSLRLRTLASFVERGLLSRADGIVVVSEALRRHVIEQGAHASRVIVERNGYDQETFFPRQARPSGEAFTIAFVGSLKPWHGLDDLVEAFVRAHGERPQARLLVMGEGPERQRIEARLATLLPPDAMEFTGALPQRELAERLRGCDAAVAPYPANDDFYFSPLKLAEYAATGLPIVATNIGQIAAHTTHEKTALLVAPGDVAAFAGSLVRLIDDAALCQRLGSGAATAVSDRSWSAIAERILNWMTCLHPEAAILLGAGR